MAELILVRDIVFMEYPDGYDTSESDGGLLARTPDEKANVLQTFAAATDDAELTLTTNDGGVVYLLRKDGSLFVRSKNLDE